MATLNIVSLCLAAILYESHVELGSCKRNV